MRWKVVSHNTNEVVKEGGGRGRWKVTEGGYRRRTGLLFFNSFLLHFCPFHVQKEIPPTQWNFIVYLIPPVLHDSGRTCESVFIVTYFVDSIISNSGRYIWQHSLDPLMESGKSYGPCSTVRSWVRGGGVYDREGGGGVKGGGVGEGEEEEGGRGVLHLKDHLI